MSDILNKATVLVLNRNWQAIHVRTPQEACCMLATQVATAPEIDGEDHARPVTWEGWITLTLRPQDNAVRAVRGPTRGPTLIVAVNYGRVPKKRPKLCARAIRERDGADSLGFIPRPSSGHFDSAVPSRGDAARRSLRAGVRHTRRLRRDPRSAPPTGRSLCSP